MILRLGSVFSMDATAMKNLEFIRESCEQKGVRLIVSNAQEHPLRVMKKAGFIEKLGEENFVSGIDEALRLAAQTNE